MARFYVSCMNGVCGVVTEKVFLEIEHHEQIEEEARQRGEELVLYLPKPIFTFADDESLREWVTGSVSDMEELLAGHEVFHNQGFYVPFSCGFQWDHICSNQETIEDERGFRTTLREAMDTFGLIPRYLIDG